MKKGVIGLMLMACVMSACQKDVSDPNYNPNLGASVPDNFEWSTTKTLNVNVEVKDEYNGKYYYAVRVYDKAPGEGVLPVAASGKVNKDFPFSQKIVVPATVTKLYIVQAFKKADASEVITKQEIAADGGNIACSFGNGSSAQKASTRAGTVVEAGDVYTISAEQKFANITVKKGGELKFTEGGTLFQCTIKIEDGGKMTASTGTTLTLKNSELRNYGEVHIYDINVDNGSTLYNGDAMEGENEGGCFYANDITLNNGHGGDKRYLGERSYTSCNQLVLNNVKLTLKTSAWLNCKVLFLEKGGANALLGEGSTISETNYVGLATIGEISFGKNADLTIGNNILVQCKNTSIKQPNVVDDATGMIEIVGTTCNEGGFGNNEKVELGKYTYIFEDMYPNQGDYDMNDIVTSLTATLGDYDDDEDDDDEDDDEDDEEDGNVLTIKGQLKAVGAAYAITPYIEVNNTIKPLFKKNGQAVESHVILTNNTETSSPINTISGNTNYQAQTFTLKFYNVKEGLNMDDIDFYIVVNDQEIHWNTRNSGEEEATWGMRIPGLDFKWSQEKVKITKAYPEFTKWFEDSSYPWYLNSNSDLTY